MKMKKGCAMRTLFCCSVIASHRVGANARLSRHCERSEAIHLAANWIASSAALLAMTAVLG
jgi:hypothetical protein